MVISTFSILDAFQLQKLQRNWSGYQDIISASIDKFMRSLYHIWRETTACRHIILLAMVSWNSSSNQLLRFDDVEGKRSKKRSGKLNASSMEDWIDWYIFVARSRLRPYRWIFWDHVDTHWIKGEARMYRPPSQNLVAAHFTQNANGAEGSSVVKNMIWSDESNRIPGDSLPCDQRVQRLEVIEAFC